jgi:hypothetical protein
MTFNEPVIIIQKEEDEKESASTDLRRVLINAIKMQAVYSKGKINILETSDMIN